MQRHRLQMATVKRTLVSVLCTTVLIVGKASGQALPSECGGLSTRHAQTLLEQQLPIFTDPSYAPWRSRVGIAGLQPNVAREVLSEAHLCRAVMRVAFDELLNNILSGFSREAYDFVILKYGDYYDIVMISKPGPEGMHLSGWVINMYYVAGSMDFLDYTLTL